MPERIALASQAEAAALDFDPRITNSEGSEYGHHDARVHFANSHGFSGEYHASSVALSVTPVAKDEAGMQRDGWYSAQRRLRRLESPEAVGRTAARRTLRRLGARKVTTQDVPVVFDPDMAASLLRSVCGAVSGSAIYRGASFLAGKLGQHVAANGSRWWTTAGCPARSDRARSTARVANAAHHGHRGAGVDQLPAGYVYRSQARVGIDGKRLAVAGTATHRRADELPRVPGTDTPEEIIRSVDRGLYVTEMIGFGVNLVTGDYSRGAVGIWIEKGEFAYPVEEITIAGNLKDMLCEIEMIGNDLEWRSSVAAPTCKIARMTIAGN